MPTRRILTGPPAVIKVPRCVHPDHAPKDEPREPGNYVHDCPGCGATTLFSVTPRDRMG